MFRSILMFMYVIGACVSANFALAENPIGVLKAKNHLVEVFTGEEGPLYSVKNVGGELLASKLTRSDLVDKYPELAPLIEGYADDASLGPKLTKPMDVLKADH